jgi:hypothetical protein
LALARVELAVVVVVVLTQDGLRLVFDARELSVAAHHGLQSSVQRVDGERELGDIQAGFGVVAVIVVDARALLEHLLQDRVELLGQDQVHPLLLLRARVARILGGSLESLLRGRDRVVVRPVQLMRQLAHQELGLPRRAVQQVFRLLQDHRGRRSPCAAGEWGRGEERSIARKS